MDVRHSKETGGEKTAVAVGEVVLVLLLFALVLAEWIYLWIPIEGIPPSPSNAP